MARQSMCANHRDTPAVARCLHCNRPICEQCTREITGGRFCSEDHAEKYLQFQAERKPIKVRKHRGCLSRLIMLIILAGAVALGLHLLGYNVPVVTDALGPSPFLSDRNGGSPASGESGESTDDGNSGGDETPPAPPQPERDPTIPTPYQF